MRANNHGGLRQGAGRRRGSVNTKTRQIAEAIMEQGITPLEVMLEAMRTAYHAGDMINACTFAKAAAPYIHPRLQAIELNDYSEELAPVNIIVSPADIKAALIKFNAHY